MIIMISTLLWYLLERNEYFISFHPQYLMAFQVLFLLLKITNDKDLQYLINIEKIGNSSKLQISHHINVPAVHSSSLQTLE